MTPRWTLATLLSRCVGPLAREFGFRRNGRTLRHDAAGGDAAFVNFRAFDLPDSPGFYVPFGVAPTTMVDWISHVEGERLEASLATMLLDGQVLPPAPFSESIVDSRWVLARDSPHTRIDVALADIFHTALLPGLVRLLDRETLIAELREQGSVLSDERLWTYPGVFSAEAAEIIARLDDSGARSRIEQLLAVAETESLSRLFGPWVRSTLAGSADRH